MMKDSDIYRGVELGLTFLLVASAVTLIRDYLPKSFQQASIPVLAAAFFFGWLNRKNSGRAIQNLVAILAAGILLWALYSALDSTLLYKDIILICIRTIFFLEVALSLNAGLPKFLSYLQSLSILLVMSYPLLGNECESDSVIILAGYFILLLFIFNTRFYGSFDSVRGIKGRRYHSVYLAVLLFIAVASLSWVFFVNLPLAKINKGGIFLEKELSLAQMADVETEYYDLQERLQKEIIKLLPKLESSKEQYEILQLLNEVIKDTLYTQEVRRAESGLISRLKSPGPGIEKADTQDITSRMKKYTQKKIAAELRRIISSIREKMNQNRFGVMGKLAVLMRLNKTLYGDSYRKLNEQELKIKKSIARSLVNERAKEEIGGMVEDLKAWKIFELYRAKLESLQKKINSLGEDSRKMVEGLPLKIEGMENPADLKGALAAATTRGEGESNVPKEVREDFKDALFLKAQLLVAEDSKSLSGKLKQDGLSNFQAEEIKEKLEGVKNSSSVAQLLKSIEKAGAQQAEDSVSLELQSIAELKMDILQEESKKEKEVLENARLLAEDAKEGKGELLGGLMNLFFIAVLFLIFLILILLLNLYFAIERKKKLLLEALKSDPRKFLLAIFENANKILAVFNFRQDGVLPPLELAYSVQKKYSIGNNLFSRLAVSYEEAKYSKHALGRDFCIQALDDYNNFLSELFLRHGKTTFFISYLKALFMMLPFSLPKE
jgi:hypothetical protein